MIVRLEKFQHPARRTEYQNILIRQMCLTKGGSPTAKMPWLAGVQLDRHHGRGINRCHKIPFSYN